MKPWMRWSAVLAVAVAAIAGGIFCAFAEVPPLPASERPDTWAAPIADRPGLPNLHRVTPELYRSAQPDAAGMAEAVKMGIKSVINLRSGHGDRPFIHDQPLKRIEIPIHTNDLRDEHVVAFLKAATNPANQPVLVHCWHGSDRTGTMVAMYRICVQHWPKAEALREMQRGGFGYHAMFANLIEYIQGADVAGLCRAAGIPAPASAQAPAPAPARGE